MKERKVREKNTARVNLRLLRYELRKSVNGKCSLQVFCSVVEMEIKNNETDEDENALSYGHKKSVIE